MGSSFLRAPNATETTPKAPAPTRSRGFLLLAPSCRRPQAVLRYGTPNAEPLGTVTVSQMEGYLAEGHFDAGSMGPKVTAICRFVRASGRPGHTCGPMP